MSIWASLEAPDDDHPVECAVYVETPPGNHSYEFSENPCDCGQPDAPIIYQDSHVLPSLTDPRGGEVDLALIPPHVRYWRENPDGPVSSEPDIDTSPPEPFLRFGVNEGTVILDRRAVQKIHETLTWWLNATEAAA